MADIIQLLPDSIANQIAAGEVIQRPASVVKELVENAVDADAKNIKLILKDSGKTLIQVIDDGKGMSESDARMAFERHATSKITNAQDLFKIKTKGFRGEALASIAAISHVDLLTRNPENELGTHVLITGSNIQKHEFCQAAVGSIFSVRNLFYNVPARRKFLKSDAVELRHIIEELIRVSLAHPEIFFSMHHNDKEIYHLPVGNLRQRIISIFGKSYNDRIVPVNEGTENIIISGFIGKPEFAKKTRGEQYLFVNKRFIKSNYLNHAIKSCFDDLITKEHYPGYMLYMEMDPEQIDVNVHPTKTEIKFEEERLIYNYLKVAVKHALGQYNVTPAIDFEVDYNFTQGRVLKDRQPMNSASHHAYPRIRDEIKRDNQREWQSLYDGLLQTDLDPILVESKWSQGHLVDGEKQPSSERKQAYQIHNTFIISQIKSGFLLIDQNAAHERILYEKYLKSIENQGLPIQKNLFPENIQLNMAQSETMEKIISRINKLGFDIVPLGQGTYVVHGEPVGMEKSGSGKALVEKLLHQFENNLEFQLGINENLARSMAVSTAIKPGINLTMQEMDELIDQLFACSVPYISPSGRKCFISMELDELKKRFTIQ